MIYLLFKYSLLFIAAVALGVLLGRWWIRRGFVDVTDSYTALAAEEPSDHGTWEKLWKRLDRLDGGIEPKLNSALAALPGPSQPSIDLKPIEQRMRSLESQIKQAATSMQRPDMAAVTTRLQALEERLVTGLEAINQPRSLDSSKLDQRLAQLEQLIRARDAVLPDFSPLQERIADLERYVRTLPRTHHQLDLSPIKHRVESIEALLKGQGSSALVSPINTGEAPPLAPDPVAETPTPKVSAMTEGPTLFDTPQTRERDDLKKILGVGPKLENVLNDNGVYYFWQIASWSEADIEFMDDRLEMFKGRIKRDGWVTQAQHLQDQAGSAARPRE